MLERGRHVEDDGTMMGACLRTNAVKSAMKFGIDDYGLSIDAFASHLSVSINIKNP